MSATLQESPPVARGAGVDPRSLHATRGWSVPARLAWRDARRHRGRTAIALLMIGLPVLLATGLATSLATITVSGDEQVPRRLGAAQARFSVNADPRVGPTTDSGAAAATVTDVVGEVPAVTLIQAEIRIDSSVGTSSATLVITDPGSPLTNGLFELIEGRLPERAAEVAIAPGLLDSLDVAVGDTVTIAGGERLVTGIAHATDRSRGSAWALGVPGGTPGLLSEGDTRAVAVLAGLRAPLTAEQEIELLERGVFLADTRESARVDGREGIVVDPASTGGVVTGLTALTLVIIQLTLLAGPAFAVGVRQQRRTLAQLSATGADAKALRRAVLTQAGLVGLLAAAAAAVLGTAGACAFMTVARPWWRGAMGPLDVPWDLVVFAAGLGVVAAVLAALLPAINASRAPAVAASGGRGATGYPWLRFLVGGAVFMLATGLMVYSVIGGFGVVDQTGIVVSLLGLTVGMLLTIPLLVAWLLPLGRVLPPVWRLATRDAARAAGRSVAAVAAVAAATGGLVAVTTFYGSVDASERRQYQPVYQQGAALVRVYPPADPASDDAVEVTLARARTTVDTALPGVRVVTVGGVPPVGEYLIRADGCPQDCPGNEQLYDIAVSDAEVSIYRGGQPWDYVNLTSFVAAGGVVVSTDTEYGSWGGPGELVAQEPGRQVSIPVEVRVVEGSLSSGGNAVMSPATADRLFGWQPDRLVVGEGELTQAQLADLADAVGSTDQVTLLYDSGYTNPLRWIYALLVAAAITAVVGGTLAATALSLADARRERAVVAAVGARPRTSRLAAGATAVVIAAVGAVAGTVLGLVPGVIAAVGATDDCRGSYLGCGDALPGTVVVPLFNIPVTVVIPWLAIVGVVVVLPLLLGAVVALLARGPSALEGARATVR